MLPIDHHVQNALYKFNREMKRLNQGATVRSLARQPSKDGHDVDRPEMVEGSIGRSLTAFAAETSARNNKC